MVNYEDLDSLIMDLEVSRKPDSNIRIKFVAIAGGCGPELSISEGLARDLYGKLKEILAVKL